MRLKKLLVKDKIATRFFIAAREHIKCGLFLATLILSILGRPLLADTETPLKVSGHSAPPSFFRYLFLHDGGNQKFDQSGTWVPPENADIMVVFIQNSQNMGFVPAKLYSSLQTVLAIVNTHFYEIPSDAFGDTLDSDVYLISFDRLLSKLEEIKTSFPTDPSERSEFATCVSAGLINSFYERGDLNADYNKIGKACLAWAS